MDERAVRAVLARPLRRLEEDFIVGLQTDFDTSLLLFEKALGLSRSDVLYSKDSMLSHSFKGKWAKMVDADWSGPQRRREILAFLEKRGSPIRYHNLLFERGVEVYNKQVAALLGGVRSSKKA